MQRPIRALQVLLLLALSLPQAKALAAPFDGENVVLVFEASGVDESLPTVVQRLFEGELIKLGYSTLPSSDIPCGQPDCGTQLGLKAAASRAVYGSILQLGRRVVITAGVVDVSSHVVLASHRMAAAQVEEVDMVVGRIVRALSRDESLSRGAKLGAITSEEIKPAPRRKGSNGASFRILGMFPMEEAYADLDAGLGFDLGLWFEAPNFVVEPKVGLRWSTAKGENQFWEVPIDIHVSYIFGDGDISPYVGGGVGLRYIWEQRLKNEKLGTVLVQESEYLLSDDAWGLGLTGKLGVVLGRTFQFPIDVGVSYNINLAQIHDVQNPQSIYFSVGVVLK